MKTQRGMTIIELMIVVAIIAILASLAIPAYSDYLKRAQVTEAISLMSGLKMPSEEFVYSNDMWPYTTSLNMKTGGKYVTQLTLVNGGTLFSATAKIGFKAKMSRIGTNGWVGLQCLPSYNASGSSLGCYWKCGKALGSDLANSYLPSSCKDSLDI